MSDEEKLQAIEAIADKYAVEQGYWVHNALQPKLPEIAQRLLAELPLYGLEIAEIKDKK